MQAGSSEERNRGSRPAMDKGRDQSAKKPRLEPLPPSVPVKQEIVVHQGSGAIVAVEHAAKMEIGVRMDIPVLHCPICIRPLKPPVFQCKGGHWACNGCVAGGCGKCGQGATFDVPNTAMDAVLSSVRVMCEYDGCGSFIAYHENADHLAECPHAPCSCTEPGCTFTAPPPALVAHLAGAHAMRVHKLRYGKTSEIEVPVPEPARSLLVGAGDEDDAFLLTVGALGAATVVSAVCIRAAACPWPRYTVKMWANGPLPAEPNRRTDTVQADIEAMSSTKPGAVVLDDLTSYLTVPPRYLVGAGPSKVLSLNVRVGKTNSLTIC